MKTNFKYLLAALIVISGLASCKKYLDKDPDMRAEINTPEKVAMLVTSAYPDRNYLSIAESYSDNVEDKGPLSTVHMNEPFVALYNWQDIADDGTNTPTNYWNSCYEAIANANQALAAINEYKMGNAVLPYKGEALVARAYIHFMLVTFFAKAYEPNGANSTPGIPYVTEPEDVPIKKYDRGTVASVYAQIEKDLTEGMPLLKAGKWEVPKFHFTYPSAAAFATRFYMFKGDWDKTISYANEIFVDGNFTGNLRPWNTTIRTYTTAEYNAEMTKPDKNYNILIRETYSNYQRSASSLKSRYAGLGVTKYQTVYNGNTVAGAPFYNKGLTNGAGNYDVYIMKEFFYITNTAAGTGQPYIMQPLFLADEVLMNRAEASLQKGDFAAALADLNLFASVRIVNYSASTHAVTVDKAKAFFNVTDDKEAVLKTILQFKQVAFMGEGLRWFDILRHRLPVVHNFIDASGAQTYKTLGPDDPRRAFQIPQVAISEGGLVPNPR